MADSDGKKAATEVPAAEEYEGLSDEVPAAEEFEGLSDESDVSYTYSF